MGRKNSKGTVSIVQDGQRVRLRWRYQKKRYSLNLFHYSKANVSQARKVVLLIEHDLLTNNFDETLNRYKPDAIQESTVQVNKSLVEHFEDWVKSYRNMDCDRDIDYHSTRSMMRRWGKFDEHTVVHHFGHEKIGAKTYNRRLTLMKAFFQWTTKNKFTEVNPLEDVLPKKVKRIEQANRKPFTEEEIHRILKAFRDDTYSKCSNFKHSHYFPFVYFIFATGVRNAEAVGLRVQHVDFGNNFIHIKEALARSIKGTNPAARKRKETKNGKQRVLPLTDELKAVLFPLLQNKKPDDLVFQSPTGKAIDDNQFQKRTFRNVLKGLGIEHRVLYACRHTFASRCLQVGITPVSTAFMLGNNPQTLLRNYTHLVSLPTDLPKVS